MDRRRFASFLNLFTLFGGLCIVLPFLVIGGPVIESKLFPVLVDVHIVKAERNGPVLTYDVVGTKVRPCEYLGASALAGPAGGYPEMVTIEFPETGSRGLTRPTGMQSMGLWQISPVNDGDLITILLRHRCHTFGEVTLQLGPWEVKK